MIGKRLLTILRGATPAPDAETGSALSWGDREAITADLAPAEAAEPGLGRALAEYVISGTGSDVLLRLQAVQAQTGLNSPAVALREALFPHPHAYGVDKEQQAKRLELRMRVLFGLQGFDAAAMRRYGEVLVHGQKRTYFYYYPGTDRSPAPVRELIYKIGHYRKPTSGDACGILTIPRLLSLLALDGAGVAALLDCLFSSKGEELSHTTHHLSTAALADVLAAEPDAATAAIRTLSAPARTTMLAYVGRTGLAARDPRFAGLAFRLAGDGARTVRQAALAVLAAAPEDSVAAMVDEHLASRDADARLAAVNVLAARGSASLPRLAQHEAGEASKKVLQAITAARATLTAVDAVAGSDAEDGPDGYTAVDGSRVEAPPFVLPADEVPPDTEALFAPLVAAANESARREYDALTPEQRKQSWMPKQFTPPFKPDAGRHVAAVMAGARGGKAGIDETAAFRAVSPAIDGYATETRRTYVAGLAPFLDRPDVSLQALVRLRLATQDARAHRSLLWSLFTPTYIHMAVEKAIARRVDAGADVRVVVAAAEERGFKLDEAMRAMTEHWYRPRLMGQAPNPTGWTLLARQFPLIDELSTPTSTRGRRWDVENLVNLMEFFPKLPRRYFRFFLDRASEGAPRIRNRVRTLLAQAGDLTPIIVPMLGDGDAKRRTNGARWLGDRRDPAAVPALWAALRTEKHVAPRAAILAALDACGEDISGEFSEDKLLADAQKNLPKTRADYSPLFDAERLPMLHWADGREVPKPVVQWWFAQSHKLKLPGGDPLLHMALDRLDRSDAERLGLAVLSAFVQYDTMKPTSDEANAYAQAGAASRHQSFLRWNPKYTLEEAFNELRREKLAVYLHSALDHRGLLALCRHAPATEAVAIARRFLRDHGARANQCRALIDALAANPVPAVLQFILATSQRFKQPGTRKYAGEVANALAEERGWSAAELADRTVPTAGLDDDGVLVLSIGGRAFRARLVDGKKDGLALAIENPDGKAVSALPTPADPAGAEDAKAAKKALSAAKKELKQTVELQTQRLYEAMCAGRTWPVADFRAYLLGHPIVGRLLRRLVLGGSDADGKPAGSFRALDDGTFTDAADDPVALDGFAAIGIAHRATLGAAADAWATHLADYEVPHLFEQLDRPLLALADAKATEITDRLGHMIEGGALQGAAGALGYVRGPVEDGGSFFAYERTFPDLNLVAAIEFTGSYIGNTSTWPGALRGLRFYRVSGGDGQQWRSEMPLGQVPPVLLSEAWNDYHAVAARGTGFDPAWEKKASW